MGYHNRPENFKKSKQKKTHEIREIKLCRNLRSASTSVGTFPHNKQTNNKQTNKKSTGVNLSLIILLIYLFPSSVLFLFVAIFLWCWFESQRRRVFTISPLIFLDVCRITDSCTLSLLPISPFYKIVFFLFLFEDCNPRVNF